MNNGDYKLAEISTLIVKIASLCNIDCAYCYEYNKGDSSWREQPKRLSLETARSIGYRIAEYCAVNDRPNFTVVFHGGEPLLVGPRYFESVLQEIRLAASGSTNLGFGVQTNGVLLSDEFLDVFGRNEVSVGVSLDGDAFANRHRVDKRGKPTAEKVAAAIRRLNGLGRLSGIQAVIDLWSPPERVLASLASFNPPLLELAQPLGSHENPPYQFAPPISLGQWMVRAYDFWASDDCMRGIKIAVFAEALRSMLHGKGSSDWFPGLPPNYLVVTPSGGYEGLDALKINGAYGRELNLSVRHHTIQHAVTHPFISLRGGEGALPVGCRSCAINDWCCGGSYPSRYGNGRGFDNPSIYCSDMKQIFSHLGKALVSSDIESAATALVSERLNRLNVQSVGVSK